MRWGTALACAIAGIALAGCGSTQTPAKAVALWASPRGASLSEGVSTLLADSHSVHAAIIRRAGVKQLHTVCVELLNDAQGTNDALPTPDAQLTRLLSEAYGHLVHAANACYTEAASRVALAAADRERSAAIGLLIEAVLREEAVTGSSLHIPGIL